MSRFAYSLRYVFKLRWNNVAKIISLSLGLAVGLVLFSMVTFHLSFDNFFPDGDRVYQMRCRYSVNGEQDESEKLFAPVAPALKEEVAGVESATRMFLIGNSSYLYNGNWFSERTIYGDSLLFDVLDFGVVSGDPHKGLAVADNMFVSQSFAKRIFGEQDPIGKVLMCGNIPTTVTGVFRDVPKNCHLEFDAIISFASIERERAGLYTGWNGGDSFNTYVKFAKGVSCSDVETKLPAFFKSHGAEEQLKKWGMSFFFSPIKTVHSGHSITIMICSIVSILAFVLLFIAALNVVLLSLASLTDRARTIGVHKCNGARSSHIFSMILVETGMLIVLSAIIAVALLLALGTQVEALTGQSLSTLFSWSRLWFAALVILFLFLASGIMPARVFASVPVTTAFRGSSSNKRTWKRILLFFQLTAATFVFIFLIVIVRQYNMLINKDIGYKPDNVLYAYLSDVTGEQFSTLHTELLSMPKVEETGVVSDLFMGLSGQPAYDVKTRELLFGCRTIKMDSRSISLLDIKLVAGKFFEESMGWKYAIVNSKYVELMHWTDDPVGKLICDSEKSDTTDLMTVVGVVESFMTQGMREMAQPIVIHPFRMRPERTYEAVMLIKVHEVSPQLMGDITAKLTELLPTQRILVNSYRQTINSLYDDEKNLRNTVSLISLVILAIALTGIVGYIGYEMRRRSREIAIRKVHGASRWDVLKAVSTDVLVVTAISIVAGIALAYYLSEVWLRQFAYKIPLSAWIFVVGGLLVLLAVAATVLIQTRRIVNENPVESIKTE